MEKTMHSPTPWKIADWSPGDDIVQAGSGAKIAAIRSTGWPSAETKANAAHIVKCVNQHDILAEALDRVTSRLTNHTCEYHGPMTCDTCEDIRTARAALEEES